MTKFRLGSGNLPVSRLRFSGLSRSEMLCNLCADTGDEFHTMLVCPGLSQLRQKFIPQFYWRNPNVLTFESLMNNSRLSKNISKFLTEAAVV